MKQLIAKIVSNKGTRYQRLEISDAVFRVGRDWHNEIHVEDRFVDAAHLEVTIDENNKLFINDADSMNGTSIGRAYAFGEVIKLGDTKIIFYDPETELAPTVLRSGWISLTTRFNNKSAWIVSILLLALVLIAQDYLGKPQEFNFLKAAYDVGPALLGVLVITLVLGLISRLLRGENNFGPLLLLMCWGSIVTSITQFIVSVFRFNWQSIDSGELLSLVVSNGVLIVFLLALLSIISNLNHRARIVWSIAIGVTAFAVSQYQDYFKEDKDKWWSGTQTERITMPKTFLFRGTTSNEDYQIEVGKLFDAVDQEVEDLADG